MQARLHLIKHLDTQWLLENTDKLKRVANTLSPYIWVSADEQGRPGGGRKWSLTKPDPVSNPFYDWVHPDWMQTANGFTVLELRKNFDTQILHYRPRRD